MSKERNILIYSMFNNLFISLLKSIGGILGHSSVLFADGLHTFTDFITDIFAYIGSKISKKRPNKMHPFGYGNAEYITSLFIGFIIFLLGIYIIISSFFKESVVPEFYVIIIIIMALILKLISVIYLSKASKKFKSNILLASLKESLTDMYSSLMVLVIIILSSFANQITILKYSDLIGGIIIGLIVLFMSIKILKSNILLLIGETEENESIKNEVYSIFKEFKNVQLQNVVLIKYGPFYRANLKIIIDPNIKIKKLIKLEENIRKKVKTKKTKIKYISIDLISE